MAEPGTADHDRVGSLAQETAKLLHALAAEAQRPRADGTSTDETTVEGAATATDHVCTTGWCPICQVVGYVHEHPEVIEQVTDAAVQLGRSVRDLLDRTLPPTDEA